MPGLSTEARLRSYLGEQIPPGGTDADTLFSDDEIQDIILNTPNNPQANVYLMAAEGWTRKAAVYANLTTTQTGGSQRKAEDLMGNANAMVEKFFELAFGRRTPQSSKISRRGSTLY